MRKMRGDCCIALARGVESRLLGTGAMREKNKDKGNQSGSTRRDIIAVSAFAAGAVAVPIVISNIGKKSMDDAVKTEYATDVLVIGSGFAGTFAALEARKAGARVVMVDKGSVGWSGMSPWASDCRPFDPALYDPDEWRSNVANRCEYLNDPGWLDLFIEESLDIWNTLWDWGAYNGKAFERSKVFRERLDQADVTVVERVMITSLIQDGTGRVSGAVGFTFDDSKAECKAVVFRSKAVIMATGAGSYKSPGFPIWGLTFDGDAMAYKAGAAIVGKEFHDTHGAFSKNPAASYENWFWAQDPVGPLVMVGPPGRGGGGGLNLLTAFRAAEGRISRASGPGGRVGGPPGGPGGPGRGRETREYLGKGFLARKGLHVDMGGPPPGAGSRGDRGYRVGGATAGMGVHKGEGVFCADYTCAADGIEGLYAAGDALGSMLCATVYAGRGFSSYGSAIQGRRAARFAAEFVNGAPEPRVEPGAIDKLIGEMWAPRENEQGYSPEWVSQTLRNTMSPIHILYIKSPRRMDGTLASIEYLRQQVVPRMIAQDGHQLRLAHEAANILLNAEMKLRAGLFRTESRGTHYREDFPARNDTEWFCWVKVRQENGRMVLEKHPLPDEWRPDATMSYRDRYPSRFPGEDEFLADHPDWI